jgi:hypothetical protein
LAFAVADFAAKASGIKGALRAGNWDASTTVLTTESTIAILFGMLILRPYLPNNVNLLAPPSSCCGRRHCIVGDGKACRLIKIKARAR